MGSGMGKILLNKQGIEIVGAICSTERKNGLDLGEVLETDQLGITCSNEPEEVLSSTPADILLLSTLSFTRDNYPQILQALGYDLNIITIAEEMAYPAVNEPELTARMHAAAQKRGVTILGTGINPGFVLDTLILVLTGACANVERISASRVNDLSPFGPTVMRTQGVGTTVEEFEAGLKAGEIVGHVGFKESISMIADSLGWELDQIEESREPIVSSCSRQTEHISVEPGMVAGCRHTARGIREGEVIITLEHPQQIHPQLEGVETGDYITIAGTPEIEMSITPEIPGGIGTMAVAVNMIPHVLEASAGLVTMKDLPLPRAIMGDIKEQLSEMRGNRK